MARDREKNRKKVRKEKALDSKNAYGNSDPTPRDAVGRIIKEQNQGVA